MKDQGQKRRGRLAYLGGLAGALVHEIKNPLSTITVNLSLIREDLVEPLGPTERRTLRRVEVVEKQVRRLEEILNDFLQFARGFKLTLEPVDIEKVLGDIVDFVEPEAKGRQVRIRIQAEPNLPRVAIDDRYFQQAVLNLLINGIQAMDTEGGILAVATSVTPRDQARITFADTGEGMSEEKMGQIFQPFYTDKNKGTGLGLAIARNIVERHNGEILVESIEDEGSTFTIILP